MSSVFVIFDIITLAIISFVMLSCIKKLHESSLYIYITIIFAFYVTPLFLDYLFAFPEYDKFWGFSVSSADPLTRIVYDFCLITCVLFLYSKKKQLIKGTSKSVQIKHIWMWIGSILAPLSAVFLVREPFILYAFQWRELDLFDVAASRFYLFTESLTYLGICASCILLFDYKDTFKFPFVGRLFAALILYMNISIEGKRAALFFALLVIVIILAYKYIDGINRLKREEKHLSFKVIATWIVSVSAVFAAVYFMYQFSIDVKIERGYADETEVMVEAFRIDAVRDDRVRLAIYSELNPDKVRILNYPGQTIWDCFKYIVPINVISGRLGLSHYMFQHYFTAAVTHDPLSKECFMTVSIFAELIANFGVIIGLITYIALVMFFVRITDKSPRPFNVLFLCCFIMINLFDLSYGMLMIEFCVIMYFFSMKVKRIKI